MDIKAEDEHLKYFDKELGDIEDDGLLLDDENLGTH